MKVCICGTIKLTFIATQRPFLTWLELLKHLRNKSHGTVISLVPTHTLPLCPPGGSRGCQASPAPSWWRASRWRCPPTRRPCTAAAGWTEPRLHRHHRHLPQLCRQSLACPLCFRRVCLRVPLEARIPAGGATTGTWISASRPPPRPPPLLPLTPAATQRRCWFIRLLPHPHPPPPPPTHGT